LASPFTGASELDPDHKLPMRKQLTWMLFMGNMQLAAPSQVQENL
jgi:hypothetical protein